MICDVMRWDDDSNGRIRIVFGAGFEEMHGVGTGQILKGHG